jgi:hypothetical protein
MRALSVSALLEIWEYGQAQSATERALALLASAFPETSADALANLCIGARDAELLSVREQTFGSQMASVVACPQCGEKVELSFNAADIQIESASQPSSLSPLIVDDYKVHARLPNSLDLAAARELADLTLGRRLLLERCLIAASRDGEPIAARQLPANVIDALEDRMAEVDPLADISLKIGCPACGHGWQSVFDIVSFLWREIEAWAMRILHDVHILASAYGWREQEILALSPWRRQFYLDRLGA